MYLLFFLKQSNTKEVDERVFQFICCLLLRHITQLVCNGHAIYDVGACDTDLDDNDGPVVSNNQFRIATAIYPSASLMNHSCDPTVINSFYNQRLIVRYVNKITNILTYTEKKHIKLKRYFFND